MSYKFLFFLNALVCVVLGVALLIVPTMVLEQVQTQLRVPEVAQARYLGAALLSLGLLFWFIKDVADAGMLRNLGIVGLIGSVVALVVTILGISAGILTKNNWVPIVVEAIFGLGYAFMLFLKPKMKE